MTDFYVCNETGDDSNIGLESQPLKTIHRASTLANAGSTIYVLPGIYRERIIPQKSGIRNKHITYKSVEKHGADCWLRTNVVSKHCYRWIHI